jgi:hypothetical protein
MPTTDYDLVFDGEDDYIEIDDDADFSVSTTGQLTVSASIRPDVLTFPVSQSPEHRLRALDGQGGGGTVRMDVPHV